jgi:hypothetical protein
MNIARNNRLLLAFMPAIALLISGCGLGKDVFDLSAVDTNNAHKLGKVVAATDDEMSERKQVLDQVGAAIKAADFASINKMAEEFRSTRALTPSGTWKLRRLYQQLDYEFLGDDKLTGCENPAGEEVIEKWKAFSPEEPTVHIMAAKMQAHFAWCIRGGAFASKVPEEDMDIFNERIQQSYDDLLAVRQVASRDPHYFIRMIHLLPNLGADKAEFMELVKEAVNAEPYYYDIYFEARGYFQDKWLGSSGDVESFDKFASDVTAAGVGGSTYARILWVQMHDKASAGVPYFPSDVDWPLWKAGLRDVADQYPDDWNVSNFARIACRAGDYAEARYYFEKMKTNILAAWGSEAEIFGCQNSSGFKGEVEVDRRTSW